MRMTPGDLREIIKEEVNRARNGRSRKILRENDKDLSGLLEKARKSLDAATLELLKVQENQEDALYDKLEEVYEMLKAADAKLLNIIYKQ